MQESPLMIRLDKAKNELRYSVNSIATKYDLPGYLIDLVMTSVLCEERGQRLSLMSEQITIEEDKEEEQNGKHRPVSEQD